MKNIFSNNIFPYSLNDNLGFVNIISKKIINLKSIQGFIWSINSDLSIWEDFSIYYCYSIDNLSFNNWRSLENFTPVEFELPNSVKIKIGITKNKECIKEEDIIIESFDANVVLSPYIQPETKKPVSGLGTKNNHAYFQTGLEISKDNSDFFNIYDMGNYVHIYREMSNVIHDYVGLDVEYVKTISDESSVDHFFREYSLSKEFMVENFKIVVPNNEVHSQFPQVNPLNIDFSEMPWEVHIVKERFEEVFGLDSRPLTGDFIYFPLTNKLYMINGVVLDRSFVQSTGTFYRATLVKYEDQSKVIKSDFTVDKLDLLTTNLDDYSEEYENEIADTVKPLEHDVILISDDWVRKLVSNKVTIITKNVEKNNIVISKNYYDLSRLKENEQAIIWNNKYINFDKELTISFWFNLNQNINKVIPFINIEKLEEDCDDIKNYKGFWLELMKNKIMFKDKSEHYESSYDLNLKNNLSLNNWYAVIININNFYGELGLWLWDNNIGKTSNLTLLGKKTSKLDRSINISNANEDLFCLGGNYFLTNLKIMKKNIGEENQNKFLLKYITEDSKNLIFVDTARPILDTPIQYADRDQINKVKNKFD